MNKINYLIYNGCLLKKMHFYMKRYVALKDMMVDVKESLYNGWELKQNKCDSWNNMWRSIRRGVQWSLTWREFEVQ